MRRRSEICFLGAIWAGMFKMVLFDREGALEIMHRRSINTSQFVLPYVG